MFQLYQYVNIFSHLQCDPMVSLDFQLSLCVDIFFLILHCWRVTLDVSVTQTPLSIAFILSASYAGLACFVAKKNFPYNFAHDPFFLFYNC